MTPDVNELERRARALFDSDRVTPATRTALLARLERTSRPLTVLRTHEAETLNSAAGRILPTPGLEAKIDAIGRLDENLASGPGDGWRYVELPVDIEAYRAAVEGLDACARLTGASSFASLSPDLQDGVIQSVREGAPAAPWRCSPSLWFRDFLAALSEIVFSHPLVQMQMGYDAMADAQGWSVSEVTNPDA